MNVSKEAISGIENSAKMSTIKAKDLETANNVVLNNLATMLETSKRLKDLSCQEIKFIEPLLTFNGQPVVYPRAITLIQGATGTHKSRLSESIASVLLSRTEQEFIGIQRLNPERSEVIILIDTERNLQDQLPYAIQQLKLRAGYQISEEPDMFEYTSILTIPRMQRFAALEKYLEHMQEKHNKPMFVIVDVTTDCVGDFNRVEDTMNMIDAMNQYINRFDATFVCIIHENPGSEKARGHLGTEITNKASTIIRIGFENTFAQNVPDILKVQFLKIRSAKRADPIFLCFDKEEQCLVQIDDSEIDNIVENGKKGSVREIAEIFEHSFTEEISEVTKADIYGIITRKLGIGERTIDVRIAEILSAQTVLLNFGGQKCHLYKDKSGRNVIFKLQQIHNV